MNSASAASNRRILTVLVTSFLLGMAVALLVYWLWVSRAARLSAVMFVVCPPFILSYVMSASPGSAFTLVLGLGSIILANGCLYAGAATGIYAVVTMFAKSQRHSP